MNIFREKLKELVSKYSINLAQDYAYEYTEKTFVGEICSLIEKEVIGDCQNCKEKYEKIIHSH